MNLKRKNDAENRKIFNNFFLEIDCSIVNNAIKIES